MKNYKNEPELSPEALNELRKLTPQVGANRWAKQLDNLIDDVAMISTTTGETLRTWNLKRRKEREEDRVTHRTDGAVIAVSPDGTLFAVEGRCGQTQVWDATRSEKEPTALLRGHSAAISAIAFSPDGKWLATGSRDGTVLLYDAGQLRTPHP